MSKIAVLIDQDFEDSEYSKPAEAFKKAGHELTHLGLKAGEDVKGKNKQASVRIDRAVEDVSHRDFDALFIPGGYSPDHLRIHQEVVDFVQTFVNSGRPVFAICHAPQLFITARVIEGRKVTGWKSIVQDIKNAGGIYTDAQVVEDRNLVTSRQPSDIPAFIEASLRKLEPATAHF